VYAAPDGLLSVCVGFLQDPHAPRTRAGPKPLGDIRSPYSSSRPLSPSHAGELSPTAAAAAAMGRPLSPSHSPKVQAAALLASKAAGLQQQQPPQQHAQQHSSGEK
jgi:hypothetical protein